MHYRSVLASIAIGLMAGSATAFAAPEPTRNLEIRDTNADSCTSSLVAFVTAAPTPTDSALASWLESNTVTDPQVPSSLQKPLCSYEASASQFYASTVLPFISSCGSYINATYASEISSYAASHTMTETWCASATGNAAPARETGVLGAGLLAAAGLAAVIL